MRKRGRMLKKEYKHLTGIYQRLFTNGKYLDVNHKMQDRAKDLRQERDLRSHLIIWHGVSVKNVSKLSTLARLHLLAHAIMAWPEVGELLNGKKAERETPEASS
jgi:hypothetical protein